MTERKYWHWKTCEKHFCSYFFLISVWSFVFLGWGFAIKNLDFQTPVYRLPTEIRSHLWNRWKHIVCTGFSILICFLIVIWVPWIFWGSADFSAYIKTSNVGKLFLLPEKVAEWYQFCLAKIIRRISILFYTTDK